MVRPWLDKIREGRAICAIALTEPRGGSDAANLRLRVERDGDFYVINGEKTSISAADQADITVVFGRTGTPESGRAWRHRLAGAHGHARFDHQPF